MKKIRKRFVAKQEKSIDRLPDEILVHILSFMSTGDCVRSSILGKRWRFLWARVPNLEFDSGDHETVTSFSNFLYRFVFIHKGQNIKTLRVHYEDDGDMDISEYNTEIETLIAAAIAGNVQVIDIYSNFELILPQCIFTCKTLVDLRLNCYLENDVPMTGTTVDLPALKKLQLQTGMSGSVSLVHLLFGCPVLEELEIMKEDTNVACFFVSSPTLTRLDLEIHFNENYVNNVFEVKLDTPALKYLKLHDYLSVDFSTFSTGMLASLTEADVVFSEPRDRHVLYSHSVLEFVGKLNNSKCLKLTTYWNCMEVPDSAFSAFTIEFCNLTKLELAGDWRLLTIFLENSINLEVLTIRKDRQVSHQYWMEPKQVPVCLIYHLGKVRFDDFACLETEFNMVEYILRNAKVLKRMEIRLSNSRKDSKEKSEARKRISLFERASKACQLVFFI